MLVLDVGCGPGIVVDHLRRSGIDCQGVELGHPEVCPGLDEFVAVDLQATQLPLETRRRVETILLLDVLEHIESPAAFIQELRQAFEHLEYIVITVPARMELWSNYDEFFGHFLRYDKSSVLDLARRSGFNVMTLKYIFFGLYPIMWLLSRLIGKRGLETAPPSNASAVIHSLLGRCFLVEERLPFFGNLTGTSLIGVFSPNHK